MTTEQILILFLPTLLVFFTILIILGCYVLFNAARFLGRANKAVKIINDDLPKITSDITSSIDNLEKTMAVVKEEVELIKPITMEVNRTASSISQVNDLIEEDIVPLVGKISSITQGIHSVAEVVEGFTSATKDKFGE